MTTTLTAAGITFNDATSQTTTGVEIPTGTLMLFQQTAAPTGWTKQTTHNDKMLRVVSGTASSGGTSAFTTVFTDQTPTISSTTLSTAQMPSHTHGVPRTNGSNLGSNTLTSNTNIIGYNETQATGGGGSHTHTSSVITLNVQYVDLIIASKN